MKVSISNIAWDNDNDEIMYGILRDAGFNGIEIAPTRVFEMPYDHLKQAENWSAALHRDYHLDIPSIQSIWYGRTENIFHSSQDRENLFQYTKKCILFARTIGAKNIVFGCPKNRSIGDSDEYKAGVDFFERIGDFAERNNVVIGIEANPAIYHTDFLNTTREAIMFLKDISNPALKLNLDVGTMICNEEQMDMIANEIDLVSHVHLSEPNLEPIVPRKIHCEMIKILADANYNGYISIEMKKGLSIPQIIDKINYLKSIMVSRDNIDDAVSFIS